jgi:hypothetical protein
MTTRPLLTCAQVVRRRGGEESHGQQRESVFFDENASSFREERNRDGGEHTSRRAVFCVLPLLLLLKGEKRRGGKYTPVAASERRPGYSKPLRKRRKRNDCTDSRSPSPVHLPHPTLHSSLRPLPQRIPKSRPQIQLVHSVYLSLFLHRLRFQLLHQ